MINSPISIVAFGSVSGLGGSENTIWSNYKENVHFIQQKLIGNAQSWVSPLNPELDEEITSLRQSQPYYSDLDESVLYAIAAARRAVAKTGWDTSENYGINIGSSRGATSLFEQYHQEFILNKQIATLSSPTTTLGNISSWVASDLGSNGPEFSHSITCSTALHALLNGIAWINSAMASRFLVGGSEAPLTPFTIAQMQALKIYSREESDYPSRPLDFDKTQNTMVLGEGACVAALEKGISNEALAIVEGVGYATEPLQHPVSISADAVCFQKSMKMALGNLRPEEIDVVVMHAPGTVKGDLSELKAIQKIFGTQLPALTTNKWKIGHTFGASGMLSVEMACLMLRHQEFVAPPFQAAGGIPDKLNRILVNAVGFGGNAVSVLLKKPQF